jgi:small conductance mechanosensitive channel
MGLMRDSEAGGGAVSTVVTEFLNWARGSGLEVVLLILGAVLLTRFAKWVGVRIDQHVDAGSSDKDSLVRSEAIKHRQAVTQVITWVTVAVIWAVAVVLVIARVGIPIESLIAPATAVGILTGLGLQKAAQDVVAGAFIIAERQYGLGDLVAVSAIGISEDKMGTIEDISLRITRMRTANGELVIVPNGGIVRVINFSRDWARAVVDIPLPATADATRVRHLLGEVAKDSYNDESLRPMLMDEPVVLGVESLDVGQLNVRMVARTLPGKQFDVSRELRGRVAQAFQQADITTDAEPTSETTGPG